jgi:hypothetical protein
MRRRGEGNGTKRKGVSLLRHEMHRERARRGAVR